MNKHISELHCKEKIIRNNHRRLKNNLITISIGTYINSLIHHYILGNSTTILQLMSKIKEYFYNSNCKPNCTDVYRPLGLFYY